VKEETHQKRVWRVSAFVGDSDKKFLMIPPNPSSLSTTSSPLFKTQGGMDISPWLHLQKKVFSRLAHLNRDHKTTLQHSPKNWFYLLVKGERMMGK